MATKDPAHQIIEAHNDLRRKVREVKGRAGEDPVSRAEAALKILSSNFETWMRDEIAAVGDRYADWKALDYADGPAREAFFRAVHDLKGQAATLGYPLVATVAGSLTALLDRLPGLDALPLGLVDQHVLAITAIHRESAKGTDSAVGIQLADALVRIGGDYIAQHAPPEPTFD